VLRDETDENTAVSWRGTDTGDFARIAEITSGKAAVQQGLATTCEDLKE
jgi:hypothetical protein